MATYHAWYSDFFLSSSSVELVPSKWGLVMDRLLDLSRRFSDILATVQGFLWRLLELHILKMVAFFSVWVALEEVSIVVRLPYLICH